MCLLIYQSSSVISPPPPHFVFIPGVPTFQPVNSVYFDIILDVIMPDVIIIIIWANPPATGYLRQDLKNDLNSFLRQ